MFPSLPCFCIFNRPIATWNHLLPKPSHSYCSLLGVEPQQVNNGQNDNHFMTPEILYSSILSVIDTLLPSNFPLAINISRCSTSDLTMLTWSRHSMFGLVLHTKRLLYYRSFHFQILLGHVEENVHKILRMNTSSKQIHNPVSLYDVLLIWTKGE